MRSTDIRLWLWAFAVACIGMLVTLQPARAVPSYASQTGQPCTACHIGAFGPQLTAFGRAFKIGGYTLQGGEGPASTFPFSAMLQGSFTHTQTSQPGGAAPYFGDNNNFAVDQGSLFFAGRVTDYLGAFVQATYSGTDRAYFLDNSDIRLTTPLDIGNTNLRVGLSFNNGPTVQDPFNSSTVWGPPYSGSSLAPTPSWEPLLVGGMAGNSLGLTTYAWYDNSLYAEFGGYQTMGQWLGNKLGQGPIGNTPGIAPYARLAYEWNWNGQTAYIGAIGLYSQIQPGYVSGYGTDNYADLDIDGSYQFVGDGTNIVSLISSVIFESQQLNSSYAQGLASNKNNTLNEFRLNLQYYYKNTYGAAIGLERIWGSSDPTLYAPAPITGSANGSPNSTGILLEADYVPFGKEDSWKSPFANLKLGLQYTLYPQFNGGTGNYDGSGRSAWGNNTIYAFAWIAF
jgi:hypothetical protein